MFEKDAEEICSKYFEENCHKKNKWADTHDLVAMWQDGYNKANEWHYPSKGEYPKENKRYLCKIEMFVGGGITYECFDYDTEYNSWKDACGEVIAWKEIVLPKESE